MQKIQFYLLPNRITVTTDLVGTGYLTEYRKVYQRKLKIYKGIDNTIEFEVRNGDYRKEPTVSSYDVVVKFFDTDHQELFSVTGAAIPGSVGLMSITIPTATIADFDPQLLRMAAYLDNGTTQKMLYSDAQFDLFGTVELMNGFNDLGTDQVLQTVNLFNFEFDKMSYTSELIKFGRMINDDQQQAVPTVDVDIKVNTTTPFTGDVRVEACKEVSTDAFGNTWDLIDTITVAGVDTTQTVDNHNDYTYMRLVYPKYNVDESLTGIIDKAVVRN